MSVAFDLITSIRQRLAEQSARSSASASPVNRKRKTFMAFCAALFTLCSCFFIAGTNIPGSIAQEQESAAAFFRADRARMRARAAVRAAPSLPVLSIFRDRQPRAGLRKDRKARAERRRARSEDRRKLANSRHLNKHAETKRSRDRKVASVSTSDNDESSGRSFSLGARSVCVRLCDGYHFPVGQLENKGDIKAHEAICSGLCPGAPTRLYVQSSGSEDISEATSARGHKPYAALPIALRHTVKRDKTCSCKAPDQPYMAMISLRKDFTLRKGDAVMTEVGIRVFRGARRWPYNKRDFSTLGAARNLSRSDRRILNALERASSERSIAEQTARRVRARAQINATRTVVTSTTPLPPARPRNVATAIAAR
ncbi:MAG: DUF2865 domain-containing protein [Beijerinckiaceae bacterium]